MSNYICKYSSDNASNIDLNTYTTFGVYSLRYPKNYYHSSAIWCTVLVLPTNYSNSYVLQIGYASNFGDICYRLCSDGSWTS